MTSPEFREIFTQAIQPKNRKNLILSDVHIVLQDYYERYREESDLKVVMKLVEFLSEDFEANYPLAVNGGLLYACLRYFEQQIDMEIEQQTQVMLSRKIQQTPSLLESYYRFEPSYDSTDGLSHAKVFYNFLKNKHSVRWFVRNQLKDLRILLIFISASINENNQTIVDFLLMAIAKLFENKEMILELSKDPYLLSWVFQTMPIVCSKSYRFFWKYLD